MNDRSKLILCLDFDGVIHSYTSGWKGAHIIPDPPVPGAMEFIVAAQEDFKVAIFSSRSNQENGISAMQTYLRNNLEDICFSMEQLNTVMENIDWPKHKPSAFLTIDDRAINFTGMWYSPKELLKFTPWNKK